MTIVDVTLQGISLLINIFLTRKLGEELVGIFSLVMSFYSTFVVISNGNSFLCANRFISEERGKANGNPNTILMYSILWSGIISIVSTILIVIFSNQLGYRLLGTTDYNTGIKLIAISLVLTAMISSIKGYFHAHRKVTTPLISGCIEFFIRNIIIVILVSLTSTNIMMILSISILISEFISFVYLLIALLCNLHSCNNPPKMTLAKYIRSSIPIAINSGIPLILSTCNDALLPITLKQCGSTSEQSFGLYGMFEAIVLPIIFFPSSILCSLSCIMVTEIARSHTANDITRVKRISLKAIKKTILLSVVVSIGLFIFGDDIAILIGSTHFCGRVVKVLSPVVVFIYLEITLESILKGLGKHGFSSINYIAEYIIRISTLLICVPLFKFWGIVVSYYVSNIIGNLSRIYKVYNLIGKDRKV